MFTEYGKVLSAIIITDKFSGRSKGFGFVEMEDDSGADNAINTLNGKDIGGRNLVVAVARPREERPNNREGGFERRGGRDSRDTRGGRR